MSNVNEDQQAALSDLDTFVQGPIDQAPEQVVEDTPITDSAPVEEVEKDLVEPTETDGVQKRFNKLTKKAYDQERRGDRLQAELDKLNKKPDLVEPTLEQHDFDDDAFNKANVEYKVEQELNRRANESKQAQQQQDQQQLQSDFNERVNKFDKADYADKAGAIPELPAGVADALMQSENGVELIYHIGSHLDIADSLAGMTSAAAIMELGKLSVQMATKPEIKTSAAPDPISPIKGGSAIEKNEDEMSMSEWMAIHG